MIRVLRYIFLIALALITDQFFQRFLPFPLISILIPIVLYVSSELNLLESLQTSFILGFCSDVILLNKLPFYTIFLMIESLLVWYLSRRYIEFKSAYIFGISSAILIIISYTLLFGFTGFKIDMYVAEGILINVALAMMVFLILRPRKIEGAYE